MLDSPLESCRVKLLNDIVWAAVTDCAMTRFCLTVMLNAQSKRQNDCKANMFGLWGFQEQAAQKWGRNVRGPGV